MGFRLKFQTSSANKVIIILYLNIETIYLQIVRKIMNLKKKIICSFIFERNELLYSNNEVQKR